MLDLSNLLGIFNTNLKIYGIILGVMSVDNQIPFYRLWVHNFVCVAKFPYQFISLFEIH